MAPLFLHLTLFSCYCNEVHPTCGSCERHGVTCVWGRQNPYQTPSISKPSLQRSSSNPTLRTRPPDLLPKPTATSSNVPSTLPETTDRRLLELRLLHQYMAITYLTINVPGDPNIKEWSITVPRLALKHNSLLYSIYAMSALHLSREDFSFGAVWEQYLSLTLNLHREDVKHLSASNADAACLTASHLRVCTYALLQSRELEPYSPPLDWLSMNSLTGKGLQVSAWKFLKDDPESINRRMVLNAPGLKPGAKQLREEGLFKEENREKFLYLLHRTAEDEETEPWSEEDKQAYESTVSYIGTIQRAIDDNENSASIFRRIVLFPMIIDAGFADLLKAMRPRALVILAHFFTFLKNFESFWWVAGIGTREVNAIQDILPLRWREMLSLQGDCWFSLLETLDLRVES